MAEKINWSMNVQILGGLQLQASSQPTLEVDAYDKIDITVPAADTNPGTATVAVQPSDQGQVRLFMLTSSVYSDKGNLTYTIDESTLSHELDQPLLLIGKGAAGLLGAIKKIQFTNKEKQSASIRILVGRAAIIPNQP